MRLPNPLHYTENHRFTVFRDFSMGPIEFKMLTGVYQPMLGTVAAGLYSLLLHQLPADKAGYSPLEQQRKLFYGLGIEPNDAGRRRLAEGCSKLEAVGLLHSVRVESAHTEEYFYEYRLFAPLKPAEFLQTQHLVLLLRDRIGVHALHSLRQELVADKPEELDDPYLIRKDLSSPFYEVFSLSVSGAEEADKDWPQAAENDREDSLASRLPALRFSFAQILGRIPKSSLNRPHMERLEERQDIIARMNYYADKYDLTLKELGQLLDEDGMFSIKGEWVEEELERRAESVFMQRHKHEEGLDWGLIGELDSAKAESAVAAQPAPEANKEMQAVAVEAGFEVPDSFKTKYDRTAYNRMLQTEPYTKVLQMFIGVPKVMGWSKELFSKLNIYYKFPDAVLNALIHHMQVERKIWNKSYIEQVATSLQGLQIMNFGQAVQYFKQVEAAASRKEQALQSGNHGSAGGFAKSGRPGNSRTAGISKSSKQKPKMPIYQAPSGKLEAAEKEELERIVKYLENKS